SVILCCCCMIFTSSLHFALPIYCTTLIIPVFIFLFKWKKGGFSAKLAHTAAGSSNGRTSGFGPEYRGSSPCPATRNEVKCCRARSEEHTSELQSREKLVCRLLLE